MKRLAFAVLAILALSGCTTVHNDQRNCTHDCNIGSSQPTYVAPPPTVVYHGHGHSHGHVRTRVIYHW